jgi:hypothetical protein
LKTFRDNKRRVWTLEVNVAAIKRVRGLCKVDLNSIVEVDPENRPTARLLEQLSSDPVLLVDVLYAICKPDADKQGVTDEEFGRSLAGDSIDEATAAFLDELVDFFPGAKRLFLKKAVELSRKYAGEMTESLAKALEDPELARRVEESMRSSASSPASSE